MISRSEWMIPEGSVEWIRLLCLEMGVPPFFWLDREKPIKGGNANRFSRRELMTLTLVVTRLRLRHGWSRTELEPAMNISGCSISRADVRGRALLAVDPMIERAFTKLEGRQAVEFLIVNWYVNFQVMFDQEGVAAE